MNTSRKLKIIVIGSAAIVLLVTLKLISASHSGAVPPLVPLRSARSGQDEKMPIAGTGRIFKQFNKHPMQPTPEPQMQEIRYDYRSENQVALTDKLRLTLQGLGIEKDDSTITRILVAFESSDISHYPPDWQAAPEVQATAALALKRKIAYLLPSGTNSDGQLIPADKLTIQRVVESDLGFHIPMMVDYEIRDTVEEAKEIKAIKGSK
jgi:hypothetical protein